MSNILAATAGPCLTRADTTKSAERIRVVTSFDILAAIRHLLCARHFRMGPTSIISLASGGTAIGQRSPSAVA